MRTVVIFERGIMGWESCVGEWAGNWPNEAVAWVHKNTSYKAQTLTYFTGPVLAGVTRHWRAKQFCHLIDAYKGWRILGVCHSEGTATFLAALKLCGYPPIDELHLVCGACNSDYQENGLNIAIAMNRVEKVTVYIAEKDRAMRLENSYVGAVLFGLQTGGQPMGLSGPTNMTPEAARRTTIKRWRTYGHSDCWLQRNFHKTMQEIVNENNTTEMAGSSR